MVPSLHPICLCATWRGWCLHHVESVSLIIIELILKNTVPYPVIIISLSAKVVYLLFLVYCLSEASTFEILFQKKWDTLQLVVFHCRIIPRGICNPLALSSNSEPN